MTLGLIDMALTIEDRLRRAHIPHAFGGAIALNYHIEEPRGTRDIDVNIFVPAADASATFEQLPSEIEWTNDDVATVAREGQVRVFWDGTPIDLFFTNHPFHEQAAANTEIVPLEGVPIPILGPTELAVFKAFFNRTKDWADIEAMVDARTVDLHRVIGWMVDLRGGEDARVERLRSLLAREQPREEPRFNPPR